ncbi:MAG: hypothetical protein LBR56_05215 [Sporomusaceae bacterium]|jgi:tetratricopeptide (TPR) repeat protein|nr:hypothetical protein [Sporomusaceae bacterium]
MSDVNDFLKQAQVFLRAGDLDAAKYFYARAAQIDTNSSSAFLALGTIALKEKNLPEAKSNFLAVLSLDESHIDALLALGAIAMEERRSLEGVGYYEKVLSLDANCLLAYNDLCLFYYHEAMDLEKAFFYAQKSFALDPSQLWVAAVLSELKIMQGNWLEGFRLHAQSYPFYEHYNTDIYRAFEALPLWRGEDFAGKNLIVGDHAGFGGFGDIFLLARWLKALKARGGRVVLPLRQELVPLFEEMGFVDEIIVYNHSVILKEATPANFDLRVPLIALPGIFGISEANVSQEVPYLKSNTQLKNFFAQLLSRDTNLRVGLVWACSKGGNPRKTCPLKDLKPLFTLPGITWYSLQVGPDNEQLKEYPFCSAVIDLTGELKDFSYTAAFIDNLDLVISVDTAVAHLAGAMGKATWLMLSYGLDWRWLKDINYSPWYPSMRLFRSTKPQSFANVITEIHAQLQTAAK